MRGAAPGSHAQIFGQRGHRVVGVDRSEQMLDVARRKVDSSAEPLNSWPAM